MSNIPRARALLQELIRHYQGTGTASELASVMSYLYRDPPVRKASPKSQKATKTLKASIKLYASEHPRASLQKIARVFEVNQGRVSEALRTRKP